jgi:hypothetical protein
MLLGATAESEVSLNTAPAAPGQKVKAMRVRPFACTFRAVRARNVRLEPPDGLAFTFFGSGGWAGAAGPRGAPGRAAGRVGACAPGRRPCSTPPDRYASRAMANIEKRGDYTPRRVREQRAYRLALAGGTAGVVGVVGIVLAIAGVVGAGIPVVALIVAALCAAGFKFTVS